MPRARKPVPTDGAGAKQPSDQSGRKTSHHGWSIMRVPSKRCMRIFPSTFAKKNLGHKPQVVWWPILDDVAGCQAVIEAMMDDNLALLHELTARYPEHRFGFESMLAGFDHGSEVAERVTFKTYHLKREHQLDLDAVQLLDGRQQVLAVVRRHGKIIASEVQWDSSTSEDSAPTGMDPASFTMSVPE